MMIAWLFHWNILYVCNFSNYCGLTASVIDAEMITGSIYKVYNPVHLIHRLEFNICILNW